MPNRSNKFNISFSSFHGYLSRAHAVIRTAGHAVYKSFQYCHYGTAAFKNQPFVVALLLAQLCAPVIILAIGAPLQAVSSACHCNFLVGYLTGQCWSLCDMYAQSWHLDVSLMGASIKTSGNEFWSVTA